MFLFKKNVVCLPFPDSSIFKLASTDAAKERSEWLLEQVACSVSVVFGTAQLEEVEVPCADSVSKALQKIQIILPLN